MILRFEHLIEIMPLQVYRCKILIGNNQIFYLACLVDRPWMYGFGGETLFSFLSQLRNSSYFAAIQVLV